MNFRSAFPSKYLKSEDIGSKRPIYIIERVDLQMVGIGPDAKEKFVVTFTEIPHKAMVLNRINAETLAELAGDDDVNQWVGLRVQLFVTKVEFSGKRVPAIRICAAPVANTAVSSTAAGTDPDVGF